MLQVGNEERIHVYYAHGQDNPTFVRRCYWLLDKYVSKSHKFIMPTFFLYIGSYAKKEEALFSCY